jgi:activator of HSP90 ATPase
VIFMKTKTIKQKVSFKTSPHDVYDALMGSKKHSIFSKEEAKISRKVGGKFSVFDGYATGKNIELIPGEKIVQAWHASDWETNVISTVTFELHQTKNGTQLIFTHGVVPVEHSTSIA